MNVAIKEKSASGTNYIYPTTFQFEQGRLFLTGPINDACAEEMCATLASAETKSEGPLHLIINSPGGSVSAGLAIIDTMESIERPVHTHVLGMAASMAALIAACGEPGHRSVSPLSEVMIHQPLMYGAGGQASDIAIAAEAILRQKKKLNGLLAKATGKTIRVIEKATDRDTWLNAEEAVKFGLADVVSAKWHV